MTTTDLAYPSWMTEEEKAVAVSFSGDVAEHKLAVARDDGLYRHLVFIKPSHSWQRWFELVTWPGALTIRGDVGTFTFARMEDMFQFFRSNGNSAGINPGYWAEKLPDRGRLVKVYSEQRLRQQVEDALAYYEVDVYPELLTALERATDLACGWAEAARATVRRLVGMIPAGAAREEAQRIAAELDPHAVEGGHSGR